MIHQKEKLTQKEQREMERIRELKKQLQTRNYNVTSTSSWKKLGISNQDGWTPKMRTAYFKMNKQFYDSVLKNDMTQLKNRPRDENGTPMSKRQVKQKNGYAPGIWSDSRVDDVLKRGDELIRFAIERDELLKEEGFFDQKGRGKPITYLNQLNQHHVKAYIQQKLDDGIAPSSVRTYVGQLQKMFESTVKNGVKQHNNLIKKCSGKGKTKEQRGEFVQMTKERTQQEAKRGVGKTDGEKGYSLEQAQLIENATKDNPMVHLGVKTFIYIGARYGSLEHMTWSDVIDADGNVRDDMEFLHEGQMKGGRFQKAEVNEAGATLQEVYKKGGFQPNDSIFGNLSRYKLEKEIKAACEQTGVDYKGFHAFRSATVEYYEKKKIPEMLEDLSKTEQKELLSDKILNYVNLEVVDKDGKPYKPHNPMVEKRESVPVAKKDDKGEVIRDKKGNVVMIDKWAKDKKGNKYKVTKPVIEDGQPVMERKYTKKKLMDETIRHLKSLYVAQQISHNRIDANQPYRNYKKRIHVVERNTAELMEIQQAA
ncbi:hypothetical protein COL23_25785 [Priestia aryabhattai]|uniref:hypothetical protein n=1 Tax=Priestia aryabhattai TaxID=412384 RepID=UPI000BF739FA|nr:hypothetical protein [Priestia aryabhattai]PFW72165.1 hypothetical protein COL23_25785 [Priestia aryabhattai]